MTERDIFLALLDLPGPATRSAFLARACAGDAALRARVEGLLRSHDNAGSFLGKPALPPLTPTPLAPGDRVTRRPCCPWTPLAPGRWPPTAGIAG